MKFLIGAATAMALTGAGQANALIAYTVSTQAHGAENASDPGTAVGEISVITFDAPSAAGITETDEGPANSVGLFAGTTVNVAATPAGDTTEYQALQTGGQAKFDFSSYGARLTSLSVYVGSIDTYNTFEVTTSTFDYSFDGTDFRANDGAEQSPTTNRRVCFIFAPSETFESITMASQGIAFEYDNFAAGVEATDYAVPVFPAGNDEYLLTPNSTFILPSSTPGNLNSPLGVPEPTSWALVLVGFGMLGAGLRRRRLSALA